MISFFIYRYFLMPVLKFILESFSFLFPEKLQKYIADRKNSNWPTLSSSPIWIHASSGEIEYAKSLVRELKNQWPQRPILVTYSSVSAVKLIKNFPGIDALVPAPWDDRQSVEKFLNFFKPQIGLFARTDVWPEMAYKCRQKKIPTLLFAATLSEKSSRKNSLARWAFNQLTEIYAVSEADAHVFANLHLSTPVTIAGDTRYDQVFYRLQNLQKLEVSFTPNANLVLVAGSTWPEDESVLLEILPDWIKQGHRCVLAPHEVDPVRLKKLQQNLQQKLIASGLNLQQIQMYSEIRRQSWSSPILLVDQIGILQEIYTWGNLAFVGGSFKAKVHSVMEPLCAGLPVFVGPHHDNNREALKFQNVLIPGTSETLVSMVANSAEWMTKLKAYSSLNSGSNLPPSLAPTKPAIQDRLRQETGATRSVLDWCRQTL